jgi:hypothetical protein
MLSELWRDIGTTESENAKPKAKASVAKPAAKSTKAKKATKLAVKKATRPILSFFDQQDARVSLDGPSFSSAIAVTTKKGKGKKRTLLDSDDEYKLSCELSSSPDFLCFAAAAAGAVIVVRCRTTLRNRFDYYSCIFCNGGISASMLN